MLVTIPAVLDPGELGEIRAALAGAAWGEGRATAGWQAAPVKENGQLAERDPLARALGERVLAALERCKPFIAAALPLRVYPPMFNRYGEDQRFGTHVDAGIRQVPGVPQRVRADLSATLFLSGPEEYEGGELVIEESYGAHAVKLPAGDMVLYPSGSLHRVEPVRSGQRLAAVFWVQSMVRDVQARTMLYDLDGAIRHLHVAVPGHAALLQLTGLYQNLLRRWGEC